VLLATAGIALCIVLFLGSNSPKAYDYEKIAASLPQPSAQWAKYDCLALPLLPGLGSTSWHSQEDIDLDNLVNLILALAVHNPIELPPTPQRGRPRATGCYQQTLEKLLGQI
jgi:hypothetical protein